MSLDVKGTDMKRCEWVWEITTKYKGKTLGSDVSRSDCRDYLETHLDCFEEDLDQKIDLTSPDQLKEISEWAASYCSYMHNILADTKLFLYTRYASEMNFKNDDVADDFYDDFGSTVTAAFLEIDGVKY